MEHTNIDRNTALAVAFENDMFEVEFKILIYPKKNELDKNKISEYTDEINVLKVIKKMDEYYSKK